MKVIDTDFLVVGSGIAGLMSAIHLKQYGRVMIATKKARADSNTNYAQGGIACVVDSSDSVEDHVRDTIRAGAGLCDEKVVHAVVSDGPARIRELEELGLVFSAKEDAAGAAYDLGREGGHSKRRVLHVGDMTGREIESVLLQRALSDTSVSMLEYHMAIDLICSDRIGVAGENRCVGAYLLGQDSGEILAVRACHTVLATGGAGKVYLYTSNPDIATGDGIALAWRAGVPIKNMEFIQFHPTCLYHSAAKSFLISEAVRGEGGVLVTQNGESFTERYDERGSLAPRDIVARAIDDEMKKSGAECVYLDVRGKSEAFIKKRFPNLHERCLSYGINMATQPVPVVPAAHYLCGGIEAGVDGVTSLPGLYACGEVSCTGLHGANRLASNSLLEAVVCAHKMAEGIGARDHGLGPSDFEVPPWESGTAVRSNEEVVLEHDWNEVRTCMWDFVGIVRTDKRLDRALRRIQNVGGEVNEYYWNYLVTSDLLELRNIVVVARMIVESARKRRESRGLHYTLDYAPTEDGIPAVDTVLVREKGEKG